MAVLTEQLQVMFGPKAKIKRYHAKSKVGHAQVQIPNGDVDRVLELDLSVSGHKLRVAKWQSFKAPAPAPAPAQPANATNRWSRQAAKSEGVAMKERARFVSEFLDAQAGPSGRRSYSQVASNTAEARMKSMETAMYDMRQMLKRLMKPCQ